MDRSRSGLAYLRLFLVVFIALLTATIVFLGLNNLVDQLYTNGLIQVGSIPLAVRAIQAIRLGWDSWPLYLVVAVVLIIIASALRKESVSYQTQGY